MSKALIEKILRARESLVTSGDRKFTIRRPTDAEAAGMAETSNVDMIGRHVVGWDLTEMDVIPGGSGAAVPFDPELWVVWIADHPEHWAPLVTAIKEAYIKHASTRTEAEKN